MSTERMRTVNTPFISIYIGKVSHKAQFTGQKYAISITKTKTVLQGDRHNGRKSKAEAGAVPGSALGPDAAAVLLHNAAAEREPQTGAAERARVGSIPLLESVEDVFQLLSSDAPPPVFDAETHLMVVSQQRAQPNRGLRRGKLDGIADNLIQNLQHAFLVGDHARRRALDTDRDMR